jgi:Na+/H+-dicarboxylate symporter
MVTAMNSRRSDLILTVLILAGMVLGVALGLGARSAPLLSGVVAGIGWLGVLFKQLLLLIIYPLVLASIFMGMVGLGDIRQTGRLAGRALAWFMMTTALSVALGLVLVNAFEPGVGFQLAGGAAVLPDALVQTTPGEFFLKMLRNTIKNPFSSLANGDVLGIIAFSLLLGGAASTMGETARPLIGFFDGLNRALMKLTELVMWLAPLGVLALLSEVVEQQGAETLVAMWRYMWTVLAGLLIHGLLVLPGLGWLLGGVPPWRLLPALRAPLMIAMTTSSSAATLPVTIDAVQDNLDVPEEIAGFVLPLGATLNMDGTALYEAVAVMFIAQAYGLSLDLTTQITVFITATLAAVGAAGIPSAGLITMGIVLTAVGLPLEGVGLIIAVDRILDMCRTTVNVAGDAVGSVVVTRLSDTIS